jgi:hypothetical protein
MKRIDSLVGKNVIVTQKGKGYGFFKGKKQVYGPLKKQNNGLFLVFSPGYSYSFSFVEQDILKIDVDNQTINLVRFENQAKRILQESE